ncbi:MAG: response regulator transcription factor [Bifidobacteriaceae bacterium]|jgi:DNA-binding NarL/FixJ family response regulator|nr:response regulator transcription factor [Bifidobacteriaceae bacterium]
MTKVLLVDDQALMRMGFAMVLAAEEDLQVVGEAADGATALAQVAALRPDVVLMDVRMPAMDGIEATRRIVADWPATKVLLLTTFDLDEYAFAGLKAGASGFLLKDVRPAQLVEAIRSVASGEAAVSPRITKRMLDLFAARLPGGHAGGTLGQGARADGIVQDVGALTAKEREVFDLLAAGLTNAEIAERLVVSDTTVKTHVGAVLKKLGLRDRVHVVVFAYETGLIVPGEGGL